MKVTGIERNNPFFQPETLDSSCDKERVKTMTYLNPLNTFINNCICLNEYFLKSLADRKGIFK